MVDRINTPPPGWEPSEALETAAIAARIARADAFCSSFSQHQGHSEFIPESWPRTLEWGFRCSCANSIEMRLPISDLRRLDAQDLYVLQNRFDQLFGRERRRSVRKNIPARKRARALLHSHLSRHQIRELNHLGYFTTKDKYGREYRIEEKMIHNVNLIEHGCITKNFCCTYEVQIPVYDLMLTQKFLLDDNPEELWAVSNISNYRRNFHTNPHSSSIGPITEERMNEFTERLQGLNARSS